nr:PREDICTED: cohesin subunit SA-1-like [Latimeria chalumnae]|eukprot:XP_006010076.2 PREDICTED: cohesin subunit SA-1-like [Latimeria chalumnae]
MISACLMPLEARGYYNDYGDIIKETLNKAREIDKVQCAKTLILSLQQLFTELVQDQGPFVLCNSVAYREIKDLARRFSLMFGLDQYKNREPIVMLHKDGIKFAFRDPHPHGPEFPPQNLNFLGLLSEFSPKLLKQDKKILLNFLQKIRATHLSPAQTEEVWLPLVTYQNSLQAGAGARGGDDTTMSGASQVSNKTWSTRSRAGAVQSVKRRKLNDSGTSWHTRDDSIQLNSKLATPPLTSTLLRENRKPTKKQQWWRQQPEEEESDRGSDSAVASESEFAQSQSWLGSRRLRKTRQRQQRQQEPPSSYTTLSKISRLSLMEEEEEEEEDDENRMVIQQAETSEESTDELEIEPLKTRRRRPRMRRLPDLFDSPILIVDEL